ncbi:alpha/beta fold hydrolase [Pseudomonas sp. N040]|uniref:alpha/beta fold hydrolase n=1 Tax=Pseudomonas sp. N040 TaxID=2785325 RepID=UPI0018A259DD|nr:alpha/beta hydrolase [Pseudomonas sp. N040]MBF7729475.1 alpha/beta hydrolase [Pseudomonas sp. N040]MBW7013115.1 alpha/beta hydrolase [Pseudomonas sp. N040]
MSQAIFFAHANGFPSATYSKLFSALQPGYRIHSLVQHAHDPRFPVGENWESLVDELIHHLQQLDGPVWGVGHSLGGVLHYHAALRQPQLYRGLVLLDSPLLGWAECLLLRMAKRFELMDRITPAGRTLGRRERFTDRREARDYFAGKSLFRYFDPACLDAYVEHALVPAGSDLRLRFDPAVEVSIYRNAPHASPGRPQQLQLPLALVRGRHSRVVRPYHARQVRRLPQGEYLTVAGGHMFPLEQPQATAELLLSLIQRWGQGAAQEKS